LKKTHAGERPVLLYALAGAVVGIALLTYHTPVESSPLVLRLPLACAMPVLAGLKRRQAAY